MPLILIVEDNDLNRNMLSQRLKRAGFDTIVANDGNQAVEMAVSSAPDVILMDMNLPVMDGWEATKKITTQQSTQKIPVIGLSAHAMSKHREKALAAGCTDYETKPVNFQRLLEKIQPLI